MSLRRQAERLFCLIEHDLGADSTAPSPVRLPSVARTPMSSGSPYNRDSSITSNVLYMLSGHRSLQPLEERLTAFENSMRSRHLSLTTTATTNVKPRIMRDVNEHDTYNCQLESLQVLAAPNDFELSAS